MQNTETQAQVERKAQKRLYPSLSNPSWLVLRKRRELFREWTRALPSASLSVLDIGGSVQPYRPLLQDRLRSYVAVDLRCTPLVNVVGQGERLPFSGEAFDLVICTQMLEYAPDPGRVIAEIYRVIRPGGRLFLSVPAIYPGDSSQDRWRFLPPGLRDLLSAFQEVKIAPEGASISGFMRTVCVFLALYVRPKFLAALLRFTLVPAFNLLALTLETLWPNSNDEFAANFSVWAQK